MASATTAAMGLDAQKFGFARGERVALKKLADRQLAATLAAFNLTEVELFVADGDGRDARGATARVLSTEPPILCLGRDVAGAGNPTARFHLGRALALAVNGYGTLAELRDGELERFVVAALRAADVPAPSHLLEAIAGQEPVVTELTRLMRKHLARKERNAIAQLGPRSDATSDLSGFRRAALGTGNRAGLFWCGDLAVALAAMDASRAGRIRLDSPAAIDVLVWSVSLHHGTMREEFGIGHPGVA
jgi:hypothetical protein